MKVINPLHTIRLLKNLFGLKKSPVLSPKHIVFFSFFLFFISINPSLIFGQSKTFWMDKYYVEQFTKADGLPETVILDIYQDRKGFIWIVTANHLVRYDGINFKSYDPDPNWEPKFHHKYGLFEDNQSNIWTTSFQEGLKRFNPQTETFSHFEAQPMETAGLASNMIHALEEDSFGNIWLATNGGLHRINYIDDSGISDSVTITRQYNIIDPTVQMQVDSIQRSRQLLASIQEVGNNQEVTQEFILEKEDTVLIVYSGECAPSNQECSDKGWLENAEEQKIWASSFLGTFHGGGATKNRKGLFTVSLPAGKYELHFETDESHAYNEWNAQPPDRSNEWGIKVFKISRQEQLALKRRVALKEKNKSNSHLIASLFKDERGRLWLGSDIGVEIITPGDEQTQYNISYQDLGGEASKNHNLLRFQQGNNGKIWAVGSWYDSDLQKNFLKILEIDAENLVIERSTKTEIEIQPFGFATNQFIIDTLSGTGWLVGIKYGIINFPLDEPSEAQKISQWPDEFDMMTDEIWSIFQDRQGNIWVATRGLGLLKFNPWTNGIWARKVIKEAGKKIIRTIKDEDGNFWLSTMGNDLYHYQSKTGETRTYLQQSGQRDSPVTAHRHNTLKESNKLWISSRSKLTTFDIQSKETQIRFEKKEATIPILRSIRSDGTIWADKSPPDEKLAFFLYNQGENNFLPIPLDTVPFDKSLEYYETFFFENKVFACTSSQGVFLYLYSEDEQILKYQKHFFPTSGMLIDIIPINEEEYWCTIYHAGLLKLNINSNETQRYTVEEGLKSNTIIKIFDDGQGYLWLFTDLGVTIFNTTQNSFINPQELDKLRYKWEDYKFLEVTTSDDGSIAFCSDETLIQLDKEIIKGDWVVPEGVIITKFSINNEEIETINGRLIPYQKEIKLKHNQNDIAIEYAAVHFRNAKKNRYKYRLNGYNKNWIEVGGEKIARFPNLPPGDYTFEVLASNPDGKWGENSGTLRIVVLSPWWWTWWSIMLYVIFLVGGTYYIYQYQLNKRLIEAEALRLQELDEVKNKFYTNITHEFRTPLTIILGMTEKIKQNPKIWYNEGLEMIKRNSHRLLQLVNQMLDLAKLESGTIQINLIQGDVIPYLSYITQSFESYAASKEIKLHFLPKESSIYLDYDREKLLQIVSNLITNSIRNTPKSGDIYVQAERLEEKSASRLLISIKDTGIGIHEAALPRIFERFHQLEDENGNTAGGTGIGLALVSELISLLGGAIKVSSIVGKGSIFQIELPVTNNAPKTIESHDILFQQSIFHQNKRQDVGLGVSNKRVDKIEDFSVILIIEDNPDVVTYIKSCLGEAFQVIVAANGAEGVEIALTSVPDIVISDIMMPEKDGFEVVETLKKDERTSHIPIILLTAKADVSSRIEGLEKGADAYLAKPFNEQELLLRIKNMTDLISKFHYFYGTSESSSSGRKTKHPREDAFISKVRAKIIANISDSEWRVTQLASAVRLSREQLHRKLKALTGKSASIYIRSIRLLKAKELLERTDFNISEIAYKVGFKEPSHFSNAFKEEFGIPPSATRN